MYYKATENSFKEEIDYLLREVKRSHENVVDDALGYVRDLKDILKEDLGEDEYNSRYGKLIVQIQESLTTDAVEDDLDEVTDYVESATIGEIMADVEDDPFEIFSIFSEHTTIPSNFRMLFVNDIVTESELDTYLGALESNLKVTIFK